MPWGFAAAAVGTVAGAAISGSASKSSANTQADAANYAADLQNQQWQQTQTNLQPYLDLGSNNINALQSAINNPVFSQQFTAPTEADAQQTPGYQFTLNQGLKSVQNSAAARGLGASGAALKGAASYATGLADSTYNDVYNRALQTYQTNYNTASSNANRLMSVVGSGQNAAAGLGSLGAQTAANIGNTLTSGANATASGTIGSANAISSGLNSLGNNALIYGLTQNNAGGTPAASGTTTGTNAYNFTV